MALPKLKNAPIYEMVTPSTGKKVRYRPFLMKEEKNLMIAMESKDSKSVIHTLLDTIESCVDGEIVKSNLTTFDVEYMFLKIRSKSVGETTTIRAKCEECGEMNDIQVNIDDIHIEVPKLENVIQLSDDISVELSWPSYIDLADVDFTDEVSTEQVFKIMQKCFKAINTEDERILVKDTSPEELEEFIESMSSKQFDEIRKYIDSMPKLSHDIEFVCKHCGHKNKVTVEGLTGFLS